MGVKQGSRVALWSYNSANYKPDTLLREIDAYRISDMAAVGAIYLGLADAERFEANVVPNLHLCMIAGGMSTPIQMMRLELQYANATFINMYGQSEAAPLTMVRRSDMVEKRAQTVGKAIEGLEIRISDGKGGFLPQGKIGEVVARGNNLMNGYDRLPRDKQPIDEDGWLHTGDLGGFDEDGYLYLAGRIKDVIIRGGENISPSEIESALNRMENIREAKVMGAPHPIYGENVEACVTMTDGGASFDQEALKTALRGVIARYNVPSHIFLYDSFLNAYSAASNIRVRITLMPEWLRIAFSDDGAEYFIDKRRDTSMSAKIILILSSI